MLIEAVEVKNFRCIRKARLVCDALTAFVGRNGSGKSSFLEAIESFYDVSAPITAEDFFDRDVSYPIEIRVTYGDLRDDENQEFQTYVRDGKLIVTKRISFENNRIVQRYYAAALQIPQLAQVRAISGRAARISAWNDLVASPGLPQLGPRARSADEADRYMDEYEANHPELREPLEREEQFFGPKNIGGGKLDKFTKYVLVPAVREAAEEARDRRGSLYQLLDIIVLRKLNARTDIQEFKTRFAEEVRRLYSSENLTELLALGSAISETLARFSPGAKLNLTWDEVKTPEIPAPTANPTLIEDGFEGEISRKGHGLQRAFILTLLQHLALTIPVSVPGDGNREEETEGPRGPEGGTSDGPDLILAIEEPELYLHPQRCRYLASLLLDLTRQPRTGLASRNQVLYTTHSPYFVDLDRFDQVRLVSKKPSPFSPIGESSIASLTMEQIAQELARVSEGDQSAFTAERARARAMPVMNAVVNEGFFADAALVVEGTSDVGALWALQELKGKDWSALGVAIIPAGGKNNIDRPVAIFQGLSIQTYFVFDADAHLRGKSEEAQTIKRNHKYLRLAGRPHEDFPATGVYENCAIFGVTLEHYYRESLGEETFNVIRGNVASHLGYDDPKDALKNIDGAALFVQNVYKAGHSLPVLEQIVEAVTNLCRAHLAGSSNGQTTRE